MEEVITELQDGKWLDDQYSWRKEDGTLVTDEPAADFHPKVPSLRIPSHTARNFRRSRVCQNATAALFVQVVRGEGYVTSHDNGYSIDLFEWAVQQDDQPIEWNDDSEEFINTDAGFPVVREDKWSLENEFMGKYAKLIREFAVPREPRFSNDDYYRLAEVVDNLNEERPSEDPVEDTGPIVEHLRETDESLRDKIIKRQSISSPTPRPLLPPDFASE